MPDGPDVIYRYDGSFDGLLCCVFESYARKELPGDILPPGVTQTTLFPVREIGTDPRRAGRVLASIPRAMGGEAPDFVRRAFLTCLPRREWHILQFLRAGYRYGPSVMSRLTDDAVAPLWKAVRFLERESHLYKGFLRFSDFHGALAAEMEPKNIVLPLLVRHFCERFPQERFLICDRSHGMALTYQPYRPAIIPVEELELPVPDAEEQAVRALWRLYYRTVEVPGRHNPRCRMGHMPKRYWQYLTEFGGTAMRE